MFKKNKILIKFFEWLYFQKEVYDDHGNYQYYKIVTILGINCFRVDRYLGLSKTSHGRFVVSPIWDKNRVKCLFKRIFRIKEKEEKEDGNSLRPF